LIQVNHFIDVVRVVVDGDIAYLFMLNDGKETAKVKI